MIVPDLNLLIYAYDEEAPAHKKAAAWWSASLSGEETVGIPWIVILGFVRLATHPTLLTHPMPPSEAQEIVESWLAEAVARVLLPTAETLPRFFELLRAAGGGGNLTTDAHIAAMAQEYCGTIYSNDTDFARFPGVAWKNPL